MGVLYDVKVYPNKAFLEESLLKGMLCGFNEFSLLVKENCLQCS